MDSMKKAIFSILMSAGILFPLQSLALTATWQSQSATSGTIYPTNINGALQRVSIGNFSGSVPHTTQNQLYVESQSTGIDRTGTASFEGGAGIDSNQTVILGSQMDPVNAYGSADTALYADLDDGGKCAIYLSSFDDPASEGFGVFSSDGDCSNYFAGNVGIGTDPNVIPNALTVNGTVEGRFLKLDTLHSAPLLGTDVNGNVVSVATSSLNTGPWLLNGSSAYYNSGNVGIGTTSPTYSLSVVSTSTPSNVAAFSKTAGPVIMSVNQDSTGAGVVNVNPSFDGNFLGGALNVTNRANISNIQPTLVLNSVYGTQNGIQTIKFLFNASTGGSAMIGNPVATAPGTAGIGGELNFYTSSNFTSNVALVEAMRIDALQNVGIGTTTPLAKLDVVGRLGSTTPLLVVASSTGSNAFSNILTVLPNGNVGVGTSNPTSFIHVLTPTSGVVARITAESTASTNGFAEFQMKSNVSDVRFGTGGSGTSPFGSTAGSGYFGTVTDNPILLATANVVRVFIGNGATNNGNVGIGGTTTPQAMLTVQRLTGSTTNILSIASSTGTSVVTVDYKGHIITGGSSPTISSCGTLPSIAGDDDNIQVTGGSGILSSCVINFAATWTKSDRTTRVAPACNPTEVQSGGIAIDASSTPTQVIVTATSLSSITFTVSCQASDNFPTS